MIFFYFLFLKTYPIFGSFFFLFGDQLNMAACFWYLVKSYVSGRHVYIVAIHWTVDKSLFTRYLKTTAMFNWSPRTGIMMRNIISSSFHRTCHQTGGFYGRIFFRGGAGRKSPPPNVADF